MQPLSELVLTFHLVYRHSTVYQFPARLYLGHSRTPHHWSQRSLTERRSCKHIVNLSGVKGSQTDGRHLGPTNRSCKHRFTLASCSSDDSPKIMILSIMHSTPGRSSKILCILFWKCSGLMLSQMANVESNICQRE